MIYGFGVLYNVKVSNLFVLLFRFILNFPESDVALLVKQRKKIGDPDFGFFNRLKFFRKLLLQPGTDLRDC